MPKYSGKFYHPGVEPQPHRPRKGHQRRLEHRELTAAQLEQQRLEREQEARLAARPPAETRQQRRAREREQAKRTRQR